MDILNVALSQESLPEPETIWTPPEEFISLAGARRIAVDTETRDPDLTEMGPGWATGNGNIAGVSIAADFGGGDIYKAYYPVAHENGMNFHAPHVFDWLKDELKTDTPKVFANALYDVGWLGHHGVKVGGLWYDIQVAAPLLDEHRKSYSLDNLGLDYLNERKDERLLYKAASAYGYKTPKLVKSNMWRLAPEHVGPYAEQDAALTLKLWDKFKHLLEQPQSDEDNLWDIFMLETRLTPLLYEMRKRGVPVDVERAQRISEDLLAREKEIQRELNRVAGCEINVNAARSIAQGFDNLGIAYPRTEKKNEPSFTKDWLEAHPSQIAGLIREVRKVSKARSAFVENAILFKAVNGRVYPQFHPLKADNNGGGVNGTVSGRFSSSTPNFQQMPARDPVIGPLIRCLFIGDNGEDVGAFDYSQQEPRLTVHYAELLKLEGSKEAGEYYRHDPKPDYHQKIADMANIIRKQAKTINLGLAYGMGQLELCRNLGLPTIVDESGALRPGPEALELFEKYHAGAPFIRQLTYKCGDTAAKRGDIKTLLGRRCRFPLWEPSDWNTSRQVTPVLYDEALRLIRDPKTKWFNKSIKRAKTYTAMNRLIQGSAADMTKKAMLDLWEGYGIVPHLQVHDELVLTVEGPKQAKLIQETMENAVKLTVPVIADYGLGANWAEAKQ